jgi:signal transduction histidine kinase
MQPLTIIDENFRVIYQNIEINNCNALQIRDNNINVVVDVGNGRTTLYNIRLLKNDIYDLKWIVAWLLLVVGFLVYILTKAFFKIPGNAIDGSYAILYEILGFLFNWRIFGKTSIYTQPVIASLSRQRFYNTMDDLADSYHEVQTRNLGIMKLHFFHLRIDNEMHIIQRIAHDIKNQIHLVNLKLLESDQENDGDVKVPRNLLNEIHTAQEEICQKSDMLSNFSRINLLQPESCNLVALIDEVLIRFNSHPRFSDIIWNPSESSVTMIADENLFNIALTNMIHNALNYAKQDTVIELRIFSENESISLIIENEINETQISGGSGIGLLISERIICNHGGKFSFNCELNKAKVIIEMPKDQNPQQKKS